MFTRSSSSLRHPELWLEYRLCTFACNVNLYTLFFYTISLLNFSTTYFEIFRICRRVARKVPQMFTNPSPSMPHCTLAFSLQIMDLFLANLSRVRSGEILRFPHLEFGTCLLRTGTLSYGGTAHRACWYNVWSVFQMFPGFPPMSVVTGFILSQSPIKATHCVFLSRLFGLI